MNKKVWSIVTVTMAQHLPYLMSMKKKILNSDFRFWYIVNNESRINLENLDDDKVILVNGPTNKYKFMINGSSIHHSQGLKLGIESVDSEWLIILDPDFFVFDWAVIPKIIEHAEKNNLKIIGTNWFPTWAGKRINSITLHFAVCHSSIFDGNFEWFPREFLDVPIESPNYSKYIKSLGKKLIKSNICFFIFWITFGRFRLNKLYDTGASLEKHFDDKTGEMFTIGITRNQIREMFRFLPVKFWLVAEKFIPRRFSYFPNKMKLIDHKVPSVLSSAEHFYFNNELLGVHLRSFGNKHPGSLANSLSNSVDDYYNSLANPNL
jgi:hypothetical protein